MMRIVRLRGFFFCLIVLLATAVSGAQMPRVQASNSNSSITLKACGSSTGFIACKWDPIAIVYHRCKANTTAKTCPRVGKYYYVHNGIALANLKNHAPYTTMGHVGKWPNGGKPQPQQWLICSHKRILAVIQGKESTKCHADPGKLYWVRDLTKYVYNSPVIINGKSIPVHMVAIAYKIGGKVNDGVFVCYQSKNAMQCKTRTFTAKIFKFTGALYLEHYVNPNGTTPITARRAKTKNAFALNDHARQPGDSLTATIRVVSLKSLAPYPSPT